MFYETPFRRIEFPGLAEILDSLIREANLNEKQRQNEDLGEDNHNVPKVYVHDDGDETEENEVRNMPPSIFDILDNNGNDFSKIVFGSRDDDEDEGAEEAILPPVKDPFVFIANNLTFLVKTRYPIIFETSKIATESDKWMFIALDKFRNPKIDINMATSICSKINRDEEIQNAISDFFQGTDYAGIHCFPQFMKVGDENRFGFMFVLFRKESLGL